METSKTLLSLTAHWTASVRAMENPRPVTKARVEMQAASGAPWIGTLDDPPDHLAGLGWQATLTQAGQPEAHHGRWTLPVIPTNMPGIPHNWFVTACKA